MWKGRTVEPHNKRVATDARQPVATCGSHASVNRHCLWLGRHTLTTRFCTRSQMASSMPEVARWVYTHAQNLPPHTGSGLPPPPPCTHKAKAADACLSAQLALPTAGRTQTAEHLQHLHRAGLLASAPCACGPKSYVALLLCNRVQSRPKNGCDIMSALGCGVCEATTGCQHPAHVHKTRKSASIPAGNRLTLWCKPTSRWRKCVPLLCL